MKSASFKFKLSTLLVIVIAPVFGYFIYTAFGGTTIGVTLKTNPDLERGLVGHWTFDGKDTSGGGEKWYDSSFGFKRVLTITAGGTSGGAATSTTNGYAILATTTLSTLMATSSGGKVEKLDADNNLPFDIIFTDAADTTPLDFHIESYVSTTGEIVAWIEVENISSTTAQTFHIYYGNTSATDQSDETGTWNSTHKGVWHMAEDPSINTDGTCGGGSDEVCDSTGNNYDGDSNGMFSNDQVAGQVDGSLDFDGNNDYINIGDVELITQALTISFWAVRDDINNPEYPISKYETVSNGRAYAIYFRNADGAADTVSLVMSDGTAEGFNDAVVDNFSTIVPQGKWAYYSFTRNLSDVSIYINGVSQTLLSNAIGANDIPDRTTPILIGDSTVGNRQFNGKIDEARIYNTAIHSMDVLTDYNMSVDNTTFLNWGGETEFSGGTATDVSGQGNDGMLYMVGKTAGKIGQAFEFDGNDDYVDIGTGPTSVNSVAFWVYPETTTEYFINLTDATDYIWVDGGTITATGLTSPIIYVNGAVSSTLVADQWQHVVVTDTTSENANNLDIGRTADTNYIQGKIDDVRIYNRALSAEEVFRLYGLGATTYINKTIAANPDLESGLVGHWTFDGKDMFNNVADISGQGNTGYLQGQTSTTTAPGVIGQALEFDGVDDDVENTTIFTPDDNTEDYSLSAWFKADKVTGFMGIAGWTSDSDGSEPYAHLAFWNDSKLHFYVRPDVGGAPFTNITTGVLVADTWYHVVGTKIGSIYSLYVDGVESTNTTATISGTFTSRDLFQIASFNEGTDKLSYPFDGSIDDVRVYNRALSAEEVSRLYGLGATTYINKTLNTNPNLESGLVGHWTFDGKDMFNNVADTSGQGNTGYLQGQTSTTTAIGVLGQALEFDGVDDYVWIGYGDGIDPSTSPHTILMWVKPTNLSTTEIFFGTFDGSNQRLYFGKTVGNTWSQAIQASTMQNNSDLPITDLDWVQLGVVLDGSTSSMIYNGVIQVNSADNQSVKSYTSYSLAGDLDIGRATTEFASGLIDDVRIYNRALSAEEVSRLYDLGR